MLLSGSVSESAEIVESSESSASVQLLAEAAKKYQSVEKLGVQIQIFPNVLLTV